MSPSKQISIIDKMMKEEINALKTLPHEEAKKRAQDGLVKAGIIGNSGKVNKPYKRGFSNND